MHLQRLAELLHLLPNESLLNLGQLDRRRFQLACGEAFVDIVQHLQNNLCRGETRLGMKEILQGRRRWAIRYLLHKVNIGLGLLDALRRQQRRINRGWRSLVVHGHNG